MDKERFKGFLRLSLAHHPLCWHYRAHTIRINGVSLCLGCTAFYSGLLFGFTLSWLLRIYSLRWESLIFVATVMYLPTILRLANVPLFNSSRRDTRFLYRMMLGFGIAIGLISIVKAPSALVGLIQIVLGIMLYLGISLKRIISKDSYRECEDCTFNRSSECPGFAPFHLRPKKESILSNKIEKH